MKESLVDSIRNVMISEQKVKTKWDSDYDRLLKVFKAMDWDGKVERQVSSALVEYTGKKNGHEVSITMHEPDSKWGEEWTFLSLFHLKPNAKHIETMFDKQGSDFMATAAKNTGLVNDDKMQKANIAEFEKAIAYLKKFDFDAVTNESTEETDPYGEFDESDPYGDEDESDPYGDEDESDPYGDEDEVDEKHMSSADKAAAKIYRRKNKTKLKKYNKIRAKKIKSGAIKVKAAKSRAIKKARAKSGISDAFNQYDLMAFAEDIVRIEEMVAGGMNIDEAIDVAISYIPDAPDDTTYTIGEMTITESQLHIVPINHMI